MTENPNRKPESDPNEPIWQDTEALLLGLLLVVLGSVGVIWGRAIVILPGDKAPQQPLVWFVSGLGGQVVSVGMLLLGVGCIGRNQTRWTRWTRSSNGLGVSGGCLIVVGLLIAGMVWLWDRFG